MNEFDRTFRQLQIDKVMASDAKILIQQFQAMPNEKKMSYNKMTKKVLLKNIQSVYNEKAQTKIKHGEEISILEAMTKNVALNYGKNSVTEDRFYRVFASALFLSFQMEK